MKTPPLVHRLHGRFPILARSGEDHLPAPAHAFHMEDLARDEAFQNIVTLQITQLIQNGPKLFGGYGSS